MKKILSVLCAVALLLSMCSVAAFSVVSAASGDIDLLDGAEVTGGTLENGVVTVTGAAGTVATIVPATSDTIEAKPIFDFALTSNAKFNITFVDANNADTKTFAPNLAGDFNGNYEGADYSGIPAGTYDTKQSLLGSYNWNHAPQNVTLAYIEVKLVEEGTLTLTKMVQTNGLDDVSLNSASYVDNADWESTSMLNTDPSAWGLVEGGGGTASVAASGTGIAVTATQGWPAATLNYDTPYVVDWATAAIRADYTVHSGVNGRITLFFGGATCDAYESGEYVDLSPTGTASGTDLGVGNYSGVIMLKDVIPEASVAEDGTVALNSIKVFAVGSSKCITVNAIDLLTVAPAPGSESNPIAVADGDEVEVAAGATVYYSFTGVAGVEYDLGVTGATGFTVGTPDPWMGFMVETADTEGAVEGSITAGAMWSTTPGVATFTITNNTEEAQTYALSIVEPVGTTTNPDTLVLGTTDFVSEDGVTYYYEWTATEDGTFTITMDDEACTNGWEYTLVVNDEYVTSHTSSEYESDATVISTDLEVVAGDVVVIGVNNWDWIAGPTVTFTTSFVGLPGSASNPIAVVDGDEVEVAAGATVYYVFTDMPGATYNFEVTGATGFTVGTPDPWMGFMMENPDVEGVYTGSLMTGTMWSTTPGAAVFTITNSTEEAQTYALSIELPVGTMENPDTLELGETTFVSADGYTYYYTWTATEDGTFTITMNNDACTAGWEYTVVYGEDFVSHTSKEYETDETVISTSVDVVAGDVLTIQVNNFDWMPDETVVFTTSFVPTQVSDLMMGDVDLNGDITITDAVALFQYINGTQDLNEDQCSVSDLDGNGELTITDAVALFQYINGTQDI